MVREKISLILLITMLGLLLNGCLTKQPVQGGQIPADQMNKKFRIYSPPGDNPAAKGHTGTLLLENMTDQLIVFPEDDGVRLFIEQDGKFIPVKNKIQNLPRKQYLYPKDKYHDGTLSIFYSPQIDGNQPVKLRIMISGTVYKNDSPTDQKAEGFIDLVFPSLNGFEKSTAGDDARQRLGDFCWTTTWAAPA